ncbi:MAG: hypothetical protein ACOYBY_12835 [Dermatophilaceae bacterium]
MGWHYTQFVVLYNWTNSRWNLVDLEDSAWGTVIIEPRTSRHMDGKGLPWCTGVDEILKKAFRFNRGGDPVSGGGATEFYLFQDYRSSRVFSFSPPSALQPRLAEVANSVNVYLNAADDAGNWDRSVEVVRST